MASNSDSGIGLVATALSAHFGIGVFVLDNSQFYDHESEPQLVETNALTIPAQSLLSRCHQYAEEQKMMFDFLRPSFQEESLKSRSAKKQRPPGIAVLSGHFGVPRDLPMDGTLFTKVKPGESLSISKSDLDSQFHYDFTNAEKPLDETCYRGGFLYSRPYGWRRLAFNVLAKYGDSTWLGEPGWRSHSTAGEWAVSYHGTEKGNVSGIASMGFDLGKSKRQLHGPGIYSTPSMDVAERFGAKFKFEGRDFKCVLQSRVNLDKSSVIPATVTGVGAEYFVTPDSENIRPYGLCIKKV